MKILYVTTISNTVNTFLIPHIQLLVEQGHQVDMAFNIVQEVNPELIKMGCKIHNIEFQRSPLDRKNYLAYKNLKKLIKNEGYDLIHTHTPVASACVRLACKKMQGVKVIYTAHGFHFFKGAPLINWLVYYPIEKCLAKYTDILITINKEDYNRAKSSFKADRVVYIPGVGLDTQRFDTILVDKSLKRKELGLPEDAVIILSVGELNKNKNHETVIRALAKLNNPAIYYVICGRGPLEDNLRSLSKELGLENRVKLLGYRKDIIEICKAAEIFVFPSFREGLSVALMEAMACGLPVICSDIRGNRDLMENSESGQLVKPNDFEEFAKSINKVLMCNGNRIDVNNKEAIKAFDIRNIVQRMQEIYSQVQLDKTSNEILTKDKDYREGEV
ncbi:glycosyltransferase family 1 protein [Bacillus toyonensis]|nr:MULTISPECIES: glycosyltransferase family 4 protein [Bacillus cereus group]MBJ8154233.1 glycosyltransferase family 4 protein [Bacillus cereus]PAW38666.1 glycosyltransferase family 1 protein [Bacillus toyonensis]PAW48530.1 glycosyltransferase family 1 protein [Bacillus toyonensis]